MNAQTNSSESRLEVLEREHKEFYDRWHAERVKRESLERRIAELLAAMDQACLLIELARGTRA
jgi:hypothetical protein